MDMFTHMIPVKCNVQVLNGSREPSKSFGILIIKTPKTNIIIPLWTSYYIPQNPQNTMSKNSLKITTNLKA